MKKPVLTLLLAAVCALGALTAYKSNSVSPSTNTTVAAAEESTSPIDYAGQAKLDFEMPTQTIEVTVKSFIDGDTTHFFAEGFPEGVLKARYAAVNTPESTGKLEEWGKSAARFTRSKLESAVSIVIESDGEEWETDSTGDRVLSWVWYKSANMEDYRCLNLELLQEGLAWSSKATESRYGELAHNAYMQALELKLYIHDKTKKDPDYFYGESIELDLKELRLNIDDYSGKRVAFEGVVSYYVNQGVYVESYDEETQMYFGIYVYYGFNSINSQGVSVLSIGNKVRITGVVQYYEGGDSYQVSDLRYNHYIPSADDIRLIEKGHAAANVETTVAEFKRNVTIKTVDPETEEVKKELYKYAELAMNTSISMKNLLVTDVHTTASGNNTGAMTLTCESNGQTVTVRTVVLRDTATGTLATEDMLLGKTIDVMGVVDHFEGEYQVKVISTGGIKVDGEPLFPSVEPPVSSGSESSESASSESVSDETSDITSETTSTSTASPLWGCASTLSISTALPLLAAVVVLMKKREN